MKRSQAIGIVILFVVGSVMSAAVGASSGNAGVSAVSTSLSAQTVTNTLPGGKASFSPPVNHPAGDVPEFIAPGDFNLDGKLDLVCRTSVPTA